MILLYLFFYLAIGVGVASLYVGLVDNWSDNVENEEVGLLLALLFLWIIIVPIILIAVLPLFIGGKIQEFRLKKRKDEK